MTSSVQLSKARRLKTLKKTTQIETDRHQAYDQAYDQAYVRAAGRFADVSRITFSTELGTCSKLKGSIE